MAYRLLLPEKTVYLADADASRRGFVRGFVWGFVAAASLAAALARFILCR